MLLFGAGKPSLLINRPAKLSTALGNVVILTSAHKLYLFRREWSLGFTGWSFSGALDIGLPGHRSLEFFAHV